MLYTPLLPGAAGATLDPRHVVVPLRSHLRRTDFVIGSVTGAEPESRLLSVRRLDGEQIELGYHHLLVALGSVSRALPIPGLAEHAIGLKSLSDATALRNQVLTCFDIAESLEDPRLRAEYLGFVFVGAGYAGLEGLAELQDFATQAIELYPRCRAEGMRWVLVEARERIMPEVPPSLSAFAARELLGRGVEIQTNTTLEAVTARDAILSSGERIAARTVVWTAGVRPAPVVASLGLPLMRWHGSSPIERCMSRVGLECGRSVTVRPCPIPPDMDKHVRRPPSTRFVREGWLLATSLPSSSTTSAALSATAQPG